MSPLSAKSVVLSCLKLSPAGNGVRLIEKLCCLVTDVLFE